MCFGFKAFISYEFCKYFLPDFGFFFFIILTVSFAEQKFPVLMTSSLPIVPFTEFAFGVVPKNHRHAQGHRGFTLR